MSSMVIIPAQTHLHQNVQVLHADYNYAMQQRQGLVLVCLVASFLHSYNAVQASSYCFETLWLYKSLCFFLLPKVWFSFLASVHYYKRNSKTGHGKTKLIRTCFTRQYFFSCLFSFFLVFIPTVSFQLALLFRSALGLKFACNFTNKHKPVQLPCQSHVNHLHTAISRKVVEKNMHPTYIHGLCCHSFKFL